MAERRGKATRRAPARGQPANAPDAREVRPASDRLPRLTPAQAGALRGLFSSAQAWSLSGNGVLQCMPGRPAPAAQRFELDAEGTRIGLALQAPPHDPSAPHWNDYQGRARVLAWSLAHEPALMRLSEAFGVALTPLPDAPEDADDDVALWLDFIVDEDGGEDDGSRMPALQGALRVPPAWTDRLLERADPPYDEHAPLPARWRELGVPFSLQWRIAPLPVGDWAALRPGDVIVAGHRSQPPRALACAGGLAWPLAPDPGGWRIDGPPQHIQTPVEPSPMNDTSQDTGGEPAGDASVDGDALARRLPVEVAFELGRSELRVGELSALQPGYVFPLAAPVDGASVTIRANGQAVGQGELVAVGDTLGVRLLWWN